MANGLERVADVMQTSGSLIGDWRKIGCQQFFLETDFILDNLPHALYLPVRYVYTYVLYLIRANHSKGWDAKLLAYVLRRRNRVAGLPGVA